MQALTPWTFSEIYSKGHKGNTCKAVCNIRPHKTETQRTRLAAGGNILDYPGEVIIPTADLTTVKIRVNRPIYDIISRYMCMDVKDLYLNNFME